MTIKQAHRPRHDIVVITAIAGVYGMNFKFMPNEWRYGYYAVSGMVLISWRYISIQ